VGPFYEQVWFLVSCLVLLVALVTWALWPPSEEELYAQAAELMKSEESLDWSKAREEFIEPLLERFPESKYSPQAHEWIDQIDVDRLKRQIKTRQTLQKKPESEAERQYLAALEFQDFGDLAMAENQLSHLKASLEAQKEERPMYLLAQQQLQEVQTNRKQTGRDVNSRDFVHRKLLKADDDFLNDELKSEEVWREVSRLYRSSSNHADLVKYAQNRLYREPVDELPPLESSNRANSPNS
ncbi:MAG: hypothetical protein KDA84_11010, partial [Planctomycetaceae bacterium]|nr:hypothetical protein [Planctomycetaceae bacterium]